MTESMEAPMLPTRRQSRKLHFQNWNNFGGGGLGAATGGFGTSIGRPDDSLRVRVFPRLTAESGWD